MDSHSKSTSREEDRKLVIIPLALDQVHSPIAWDQARMEMWDSSSTTEDSTWDMRTSANNNMTNIIPPITNTPTLKTFHSIETLIMEEVTITTRPRADITIT
mmetsp:Transcript_3390/g.3805  ORF Transcript_3390/g.3805 Transcript_3390/m.3805 type:complete len:102 (+) Transcript_3390:84-389(+)